MGPTGSTALRHFFAATGHYDEACGRLTVSASALGPQEKVLAHIWDDGEKSGQPKGVLGGGNGWRCGTGSRDSSVAVDRKEAQRLAAFVTELNDGC